jgi:hypothetical protein
MKASIARTDIAVHRCLPFGRQLFYGFLEANKHVQ